MLDSRIITYLLQFYLFAASGALCYLSLRAWIDPSLARRKREDQQLQRQYRIPRWAHLLQSLGLLAVAAAAIIGAVKEGSAGMGLSAVTLLRCGGFALFLIPLLRVVRDQPDIWIGAAAIVAGEGILVAGHLGGALHASPYFSSGYAGLGLSGIGIGIISFRMIRSILSIRLVDRLVIAFVVFGLALAQLVFFVTVGMIYSFAADFGDALSSVEHPLLITLSTVLVASAVIGCIIARDLSAPVTRLGQALRAIGEGDLSYRVDVGKRRTNDEMQDLARELNRMASQLKAVDELRADFFSFVSHELRTPLTAIQGFITTLESVDDFSPAERAEMYGIVHSETDRLLRMINELLDLSRVQAGQPLKLNSDWCDLTSLLGKVVGLLAPDNTRHRIELDAPSHPVWVYADPDKVQQIVTNLLSNAIKYSPGGGTVTLALAPDQDQVTISVADEGVGMTSDQCEHVFDKFYRVAEQDGAEGAKRLRRVEGAGIGLYLTRALVEAHSGTIGVTSAPGRGSVFTVTLPVQTPDAPVNTKANRLPAASQVVLRFGGGVGGSGTLLTSDGRVQIPHVLIAGTSDENQGGGQAAFLSNPSEDSEAEQIG